MKPTNQDILDAVKDGFASHGERLARIETHIDALVGKDGRVPNLEKDVKTLSNKLWFYSGIGTALGTLSHFLFPHRG